MNASHETSDRPCLPCRIGRALRRRRLGSLGSIDSATTTEVGDEEESEFSQFIADEKAISPEAAADETLRNEALQDVLNSLSYRERRVLELRYGLGGEQPRTLDEVGRTFNVTRERIRQIENQALQKLAGMVDIRGLAEVA
jgi:RNA polymerase primary sigma factor